MKYTMKRTVMWLLIVAALAIGTAGVGVAQDAPPPPPTLHLRTAEDDGVYEGVLAEYCWPAAADDVVCDVSLDQPDEAIPVAVDDVVAIVIDGEAGPPDALTVTFLEDLDAQDQPISITLGEPEETTEWTIADLAEGEHPVRIEASFSVAELSFIRYLFILDVSEPALEATVTPAEEATEAATEAPTEATKEPTQESGEEPTEATEEPTQESIEEPTAEETEAPAEPTEPEEITTAEPTDETSEAAATETPAETGAPPTEVSPTEAPTDTEMPSPTAAEEEPTPLPEPTETPAEALPADDATAAPLTAPPSIFVEDAGEAFVPLAVSFCWDNPLGERECPDDQLSDEAERLTVYRYGALVVTVDGPMPNRVDMILLSADGTQELTRESLAGNTLLLYSPPVDAPLGSYLLAIEAEWPEGIATYYFQLFIAEE